MIHNQKLEVLRENNMTDKMTAGTAKLLLISKPENYGYPEILMQENYNKFSDLKKGNLII